MKKEDYLERKRLEKEVKVLNRDSESVIVEGFKDKIVLRKLGYRGKIFLSAEKSIEDLVDQVTRQVNTTTILTDFDSHGKEQNKKISHELNKEITVLNSARKQFGKTLTSSGRRDIEDISPLFESKENKFVEAALDRLYFKS